MSFVPMREQKRSCNTALRSSLRFRREDAPCKNSIVPEKSVHKRQTDADGFPSDASANSTQEYGGPELFRDFEQYYAMLRHIGSIGVLRRTQILVLPKIA